MWVRVQNGKKLFQCIGFETGQFGYGDETQTNTIIYGLTAIPNAGYTRVTLGGYEKSIAEEILKQIEEAVTKNQKIFEMPE